MSRYDGNTLCRWHLFHAIMRGDGLTNGTTYYEKNVVTWPTMCGGRILLVEPHFDSLTVKADDPTDINWEYMDTGSLPCRESGLLAINMTIPVHWYADMYTSVHSWVKLFNERFGGEYRASVSVLNSEGKMRGGVQEISMPLDHKRLVAIMSVENVNAHDEYGGGYVDEWECEECGGTVYEHDEGYCEDCEWNTCSPDNYSPDEDEEAGLTGDPIEDYDTLYNWDNAMQAHRWTTDTEALRWEPDTWPIANGKWGTCLVNVQGKRDPEVMRDHSFDLDRLICKELAPQLLLNEGVVMISSNIAEPAYDTPYLMWQLINNAPQLNTSYGITLLHNKEHFATNPNERNHWIDGIILVATNESYVRQCNARGRDM